MGNKKTWFQISFWVILWFLAAQIFGRHNQGFIKLMIRTIPILISVAIIVWINLEILIPRLYFEKGILVYILAGTSLIILLSGLIDFIFSHYVAELFQERGIDNNRPPLRSVLRGARRYAMAFPFFTTFLGSAFYEIGLLINKKEKEVAAIKGEKLETEVKFLKSQLNPHFLFNALNNIYSLSVLKSERAPTYIHKLSEMLRYVLYDCTANKVSLKQEVEYLQNFVDMMQLKDEGTMNIEFKLGKYNESAQVAPLLFIPLVENAFKHGGLEDLENGWLKISLDTIADIVQFEVINSIPIEKQAKDAQAGIGLENVKKQLNLLYPKKHELTIVESETKHAVSLKLNIS